MDIIKHGKRYHAVRFFCTECGCIFTAGLRREMALDYQNMIDNIKEEPSFIATCPECGTSVQSEASTLNHD